MASGTTFDSASLQMVTISLLTWEGQCDHELEHSRVFTVFAASELKRSELIVADIVRRKVKVQVSHVVLALVGPESFLGSLFEHAHPIMYNIVDV